MVWMESVNDFIAFIKESLPPDHELQSHKLFPGIKWSGRPVFIIDDDTSGEYLHMNFEKPIRWKKSKYKAPTITVLKTRKEVAAIIEQVLIPILNEPLFPDYFDRYSSSLRMVTW